MKNSIILLSALMLVSHITLAQDTAANTAVSTGMDPMWWMLYGIMGILLFAILMLSNVFVRLFKYVLDHQDQFNKTKMMLLLILMFPMIGSAQEAIPAAAPAETSFYFEHFNLLLAGMVLLLEFVVIFVLAYRINSLINLINNKPEEETSLQLKLPAFFENLNQSVAIEKEADILLDHNYDGIKELDNNLPPWWKYGFYFTIVYAVVYLFHFHVLGTGQLSQGEYEQQMSEAKAEKEAFMLTMKNKVDENNLTMADEAGILAGSALFTSNCTPCHGAKGEGNAVGPNLTDAYWLHGGGLADVFKSIKYGWPNKGMKAWQSDFSPVQIQQLASYVQSIQGTNPPNAKAPQGDLYQADATLSDSSAVAAAVDSIPIK